MALEPRSPRLAVLIDADNTSAKIADRLFEEIAQLGEASVRRIYGDFTRAGLRGWTDILAKHAIIAHQQFAYVTGKNASDIALVIDAMDLMHSGRFEGFCLVSSDSDFTRLAARIREQGLDVFGFGERKTPESFRQACRRFIYTENLLMGAPVQAGAAVQERAQQTPSAAVPLLKTAIAQMDSEDGWVGLGALGTRLANLAPDFDPRSYGVGKLSDLVRKSGAFEIDQSEGRRVRVRPIPEGVVPAKPGRRRPSVPRAG
jgi:NYN domain/OST-HTH/LOTUS domain